MKLRELLLPALLSALWTAAAAAAPAAAAPPPAPLSEAVDVFYGVSVKDPYRGLENMKDPATQQWLKAQGDFASAQLARIDGRDAMRARIAELVSATGDVVRSVVRMPDDRLFYLKRKASESQFKLVMRTGLDGAERTLVDPDTMAKATGVPHAINYFVPSWDSRTLAYGVSAGGSEDASLYLLDIASGKAIGQPIPRVHDGLVHWAPDNRSFTYTQLRLLGAGAAETETYKDATVYWLALGKLESAARPLFGPLVNRGLGLDRLDFPEVSFDPASRFMLARTTDTTAPEGYLFIAPLAELHGTKATDKVAWRKVADAGDKITDVEMSSNVLYLRTYADAPRSRVLQIALDRIDAARSPLAQATTVVPEPAEGVLLGFSVGRDTIDADVRSGFQVRVLRYPRNGAAEAKAFDAAPDLPGSAQLIGDPAHSYPDAYFMLSSWTAPSRIMRTTTPGHAEDTRLRTAPMPKDAPSVEVHEVLVPSHDGALVPLAILHRKGLALDGSNPTLLIGYGAYGFSFDAGFDPRGLAWIEQGGVVAMANVRGSGAFGDPWYRAGFKTTKPNTWKDGIACASYLIDKGYASPKTLGIWGTSAGGIFVGRAVTAAPQLFAAAIFDVGMMDTVRSEESANGVTNVSEFGTVKKPDEFTALLEMSPYHHIVDGVKYPAILLVHGLNDPRVDVWQSGKAAARLQAASTSGKSILLRLDGQAGHGIGSTAQQGYSKQADIYSFLLWQFGKRGQGPSSAP